MKRIRFGSFARLVAIFALFLLILQLFLVWLYANDRADGDQPGYRFPLPERVVAMAQLIEASDDPTAVLVALNGPDLRVEITDLRISDLAPAAHRMAAVDQLFEENETLLQGREVAVFAALPDQITENELRIGDRSIWTRYPMRIALELRDGTALIVETRDDLLTQVYSVPLGWWSGIFASVAALIVLFALHIETRPLVRLAKAAEQFGRDGKPKDVPLGGSQEARALTANFNAMQSKIEDLLQRRGVMLGALGHDLRTHLTRLRLKIEARPPADDDTTLMRDIAQMERVLESCLDLAQQAMSKRLEMIDLNGFVAAIVADYDHEVVGLTKTDGEVFATVDPVGLERILTNLLSNALKFGTRAEITISEDPPTIRIEDNGPGISPADLERVMRPFEVADDARTQKHSGSGLGLTISQMLAEAQGGKLVLSASEGAGVSAELRLSNA